MKSGKQIQMKILLRKDVIISSAIVAQKSDIKLQNRERK